ncbi:hypothetical protein SAMN05661044_00162 [Olivibacter domesticus]|uniref:Uncharacterized protein n=2 Tax=Olivibacter domesticus TaxID=407022 RepID=A0A1H7GSG7_OLID1|nr:hypothetical protein SAMN05661044_00162 [Olivibacter domesticus]
MRKKTFSYSKSKQKQMALQFLGLGALGAVMALYMWLWADPIILAVLVGGIFLAVLGIVVFFKLQFAPKKEHETAIHISDEGIRANTSPIAKAASLIAWEDVENIYFSTKLIDVKLKNPEKYAARMKSFFVRDTFLKSLKGTVRISYIETNATYDELTATLTEYAAKNSFSLSQ